VRRTGAPWVALFFLNVVVNWAIPFLASAAGGKRHATVLGGSPS
jgi:hypothetical protein